MKTPCLETGMLDNQYRNVARPQPKQRQRKPTSAEVKRTPGNTLPDIIASGLKVLFCGINPGLYSAEAGCHFARPGNRFWKTLHASGFTDRVLSPFEQRDLLWYGCGLTNLVRRATATASELDHEELAAGRRSLSGKVGRYKPDCVAVLGMGAYRKAFGDGKVVVGEQDRTVGKSRVWVLPNPSGLNAHYRLKDLVELFSDLRREVF